MTQLRQFINEYEKRGIQVLVVGSDGPKAFQRYWQENQLPFPGLADVKSKVADRYAQEVNLLKLGHMPAQFIVDPQGIVRFVHYSQSMSDIPSEEQILAEFDRVMARA